MAPDEQTPAEGEGALTINVEITEPLAGKVALLARAQGKTPEDVVLDAVVGRVDPLAGINEQLTSVQLRLTELGETEDDAVDFFEATKHDLRTKRRAAE